MPARGIAILQREADLQRAAPAFVSASRFSPAGSSYGGYTRSRRAHVGLLMTDYLLLLVMFAAAFWVLDPPRLGLDRLTGIKHLPLLALAGVVTVAVTGAALFRAPNTPLYGRAIARAAWPLLLFAAGVMGGSLYGRLLHGVENSFLNMGLLVWVMPATAWMAARCADPAKLARGFFLALGGVAFAVGLLQWARGGGVAYYHGTEYAVIPLAIYGWYAARSWPARIFLFLFFASLALAQHKNTGYLLAFFAVAYCAVQAWRAGYRAARDAMARERQVGWAAFLLIGTCLFSLGFYALRKLLLPSGNPDYRLHTYQKALDKFFDSPLVGTGFTGPATERFELYQVAVSSSNVLPTHSDPLDILANGGVIYSLLFVLGAWLLLRLMLGAIARAELVAAQRPGRGMPPTPQAMARDCVAPLHGCVAIFASALIVCAFNPVLTQPNAALVMWAAAGLGLGLALRVREILPPPATPRRGRHDKAGPRHVPPAGAR